MAELSPRDAAVWHRLAGRVAWQLQPRLDRRVLAPRYETIAHSWRHEPLGAALCRARARADALSRSRPALLRTDVRAFYPSVTPSVVARSLLRCGLDRADATLAADMLEGWGGDGYSGLPIGPPGSAIVADAVLRDADAAIDGMAWLRWVDDYLIGLDDESRVPSILDRLDAGLDRLGLARSSLKTVLVQRPAGPWPGPCSGATPM
jgi:hypothetical protein